MARCYGHCVYFRIHLYRDAYIFQIYNSHIKIPCTRMATGMKQAPYSGSTNIRSHRTKFSRPDDLTPVIRVPLTL